MNKLKILILFLFFIMITPFSSFAYKKLTVDECKVLYSEMADFVKKNAERSWKDLSEDEKKFVIEFADSRISCNKKKTIKDSGVTFPSFFSFGKPDYTKFGKEKLTFIIPCTDYDFTYFLPYFLKKVYGETIEIRISNIFVDRVKKLEKEINAKPAKIHPKVCFAKLGNFGIWIKNNKDFSQDMNFYSFNNRIYCPSLRLDKYFALTPETASEFGMTGVISPENNAIRVYEGIRRMYLWIDKEFGEQGRGWIKKQD